MSGATWLVSYPRSGSTWARFALMAALGNRNDAGLDALDGFARAVLDRGEIDWLMEADSGDLTDLEAARLRGRFHHARFSGVSPSPVVKVHDKWQSSPGGEAMYPPEATHGAIYLIRDPRDIAISWAAFMGRGIDWAVGFLADPDAHVGQRGRSFGPVMPETLGSWSDHVASWTDDARCPVTVIRYEDMLADPAACLARMLDVIGHNVPEEAIGRAVAASRFERMAALERSEGFRDRPGTAERFFRAGRANEWRERLTPAQATAITRMHGPTMARFGYL